MKEFFSTTDFGTGEPKIKVYEKNGLMHAEWDRDDPELIAAGINDLTPEEWSTVMQIVEANSKNGPTITLTNEGTFYSPPGSDEMTKIK